MTPLNLTGKRFCEAVGITYNGDILKELRSQGIVSFFTMGRKYLYPQEDVKKVSDLLRSNKIKIVPYDKGYYITKN